MQSTTVRVNRESHAILRELAAEEHESVGRVLQKALDEYRRRIFLRKLGAAYATLRSDSSSWKKEVSEREAWDATIEDGAGRDER